MPDEKSTAIVYLKLFCMNYLKCKLMLAGLKRMPAVSAFEICDKIRPYLRVCDLRLTETHILFPEADRRREDRLMEILYPERNPYLRGIPYGSVIGVEEGKGETSFLLCTGHVFIFSLDGFRHQSSVYHYGERFYRIPPFDKMCRMMQPVFGLIKKR